VLHSADDDIFLRLTVNLTRRRANFTKSDILESVVIDETVKKRKEKATRDPYSHHHALQLPGYSIIIFRDSGITTSHTKFM